MPLAPLPVILPLIAAACLLAIERLLPKRSMDIIAIIVAAIVTGISVMLTLQALHTPIVYWFGGWRPHDGIALGISFVIDPAGGAVAAFAAFLFTGSFVFGWGYFEKIGARFHILMLVFLGAITGFCLTGDIFNLFVFFELMSVTAFALTGVKLESSSIEGALNFTVMNSLGSFLVLGGIAMLYGHTGALNLAQIGHAIDAGGGAALLPMSFVLIATGLMIKAAVLPFHFWLADAHAVAPTPVCVIFSGIMVSVAVYALARIFWIVYEPVAGISAVTRGFLLGLGTATAVLGGVIALTQRHIKRMLAFSTVSHIGIMFAAFAALKTASTAGLILYLAGHGLIKGALFMVAGIMLSALQGIDAIALRGKGRHLPVTGLAFALGGILLAGLPFGLADAGREMMDHALEEEHAWLPYLLALGSALTGAAVLREAGRVFLGLGPDAGEEAEAPSKPESEKSDRPIWLMLVPIIVFLAACLVVRGEWVEHFAMHAAAVLTNREAYIGLVLHGHVSTTPVPTAALSGPALGWSAVVLAIVVAGFQLLRDKLPAPAVRWADLLTQPLVKALNRIHTGRIGDYATWMTLGLVLFALAFIGP